MAGRPKEGQPSNSLNVRINLELKRALEEAARDGGRSMAQEVERRLAASFNPSDEPDLYHPTALLFQSIRNSIDIIQAHMKADWWGNGNVTTMFEGALTETARRLARPQEDQKLYSNRLAKQWEENDPDAQARLREQYLSDGAAVARLATREAFERRAKDYPGPQTDEAEEKAKRRREVFSSASPSSGLLDKLTHPTKDENI